MGKKSTAKQPDFEQNLQKLEEITLKIESGELKLEEAIRQYEEGVKLYRKCHEILRGAEKKVQMLTRDRNGQLQVVPFQEETASAQESGTETEPPPQPQEKDASDQTPTEQPPSGHKDLF